MSGFFSLEIGIFLFCCLLNCNFGSKAVPIFTRQPKSQFALTGRNATLECKANANNEEIKYLWKLNGSYINEDNQDGFKMTEGSLQIYNITWSTHNGAYECIALTKGLGAIKSKTAKLQIAYLIKTKNMIQPFDVPQNKAYILKGPKYIAFPAPTFNWLYMLIVVPGTPIVPIADNKNLFATSEGDLLITSVNYTTLYRVFVSHPTLEKAEPTRVYVNIDLGAKSACDDSSMTSLPTERSKKAVEGSSVSFECFAVARRCKGSISIKWITKVNTTEYLKGETSRRLTLNNVTKNSHQGKYECEGEHVEKGTKIKISYELIILEKPKLIKAVNTTVDLPADGILHAAVFNDTKPVSWYKDGDIIDSKSQFFEVFPNGDVKIKHPSPAFNGIYQMVFENRAGVATVSQVVNVNSKVGCGWKVFGLNGTVTYNHDIASRQNMCIWLFQVPKTQLVQFQIIKFDFKNGAMISIYDGTTASGPRRARIFSNVKTHAITSFRGPFITMVLETEAANTGSFSLSYETKSQVPTRPSAVTTKPSAVKTKPSAVTKKPSAVTTKPSAVTTKYSVRTSKKIKSTKTPAKGKRKGCDGGSNAGAIVGAIIGTLVVVALILLIIFKFFREKVLRICVRNGSTKTTGTPDASATPMVEVSSSKQA